MAIKTINDILGIEPEEMLSMSANDLLDVTRKAVKFANDRQRRAREAIVRQKEKTPSFPMPTIYSEPREYYKNIMDKEGKNFLPPQMDKEGKLNVNILRAQLTRLRTFLGTKTSTYEGWYDVVTKGIRTILEKTGLTDEYGNVKEKGIRIRRKDYEKFFNVYQKLNERVNELTLQGGKYEMWRRVAEYSKEIDFQGSTIDDIVAVLEDRIREDDPAEFDPTADISKS